MTTLERFGKTIKMLRADAGMTQEQLGAKSGVHPVFISGIERGKRNPTLTTIIKLAEAFGIDPSTLLHQMRHVK